jgi:uncharacterized protein (TIGR02246 family)
MNRAIAVVAAVAVLEACAGRRVPNAEPAVPPEVRQTIAAANADWLQAMKRQDAAAITEPYDEDGVWVTATGESVRGKQAIESLMRERFAQSGRAVDGQIVEDGLVAVGNMVYEWGHEDLTLQGSDGKLTGFKGGFLTVWKPDQSGHWKIVRNLSVPIRTR